MRRLSGSEREATRPGYGRAGVPVHAETPGPGMGAAWLVSATPRTPGVPVGSRARRRPADTAAAPLATWAYPVGADIGSGVVRPRRRSRPGVSWKFSPP